MVKNAFLLEAHDQSLKTADLNDRWPYEKLLFLHVFIEDATIQKIKLQNSLLWKASQGREVKQLS